MEQQQQPDRQGRTEQQSGNEPAGWLWLICLFFRPRVFFRHFVIRDTPGLTALCAWFFGMSGLIDHSSRFPEALAGVSWYGYGGAIILGGMVEGYLFFRIGGWWYRVRLEFSRVVKPDIALARRVFIYSTMVMSLPLVLLELHGAREYATPQAFVSGDVSSWMVGVWIILLLWSVYVSYRGVRTTFVAHRIYALLWFAVLPVTFYGLVLSLAIVTSRLEPADISTPRSFGEGHALRFQYPQNWWIDNGEPDYDPDTYVVVEPMQDALVELMIYPSEGTARAELDKTILSYSESVSGLQKRDTFTRWGELVGLGERYRGSIEGDVYILQTFIHDLGENVFLEIRETCLESDLPLVQPGFGLIRETMRLGEIPSLPLNPPADLETVQTFNQGNTVRFSLPGNWWVDDTDEDFDPDAYMSIEPPQDGSMQLMIYPSDETAATELANSVRSYSEDFTGMERQRTFDRWGRYAGVGATYRAMIDGAAYEVQLFVHTVRAGVYLEVQQICRESQLPQVRPGFDLVRGTLSLRTLPSK